jgi:hypothetical protein
VKTKFLITWLALLALVFGQRGATAAGDSPKKKPPAPDTYTITQLDIGANVASSGFGGVDLFAAVQGGASAVSLTVVGSLYYWLR